MQRVEAVEAEQACVGETWVGAVVVGRGLGLVHEHLARQRDGVTVFQPLFPASDAVIQRYAAQLQLYSICAI